MERYKEMKDILEWLSSYHGEVIIRGKKFFRKIFLQVLTFIFYCAIMTQTTANARRKSVCRNRAQRAWTNHDGRKNG